MQTRLHQREKMPHVAVEVANALVVAVFVSDAEKWTSEPRRAALAAGVWIALNLLVYVVDEGYFYATLDQELSAISRFLDATATRVALSAISFFVALFIDVKRRYEHITLKKFLTILFKAVVYVAPSYPFLVVLLSAAFFVLVNVFETLGIPTSVLNWPIYYGTLYGPLIAVYGRTRYLSARTTMLPA
eukprot:g424.t1